MSSILKSSDVSSAASGVRSKSPASGGRRKTVALTLGSGGARGYAHIGAIEILVERGYDIIAISGCSMGALIGGMFAAGKMQERTSLVLIQDGDIQVGSPNGCGELLVGQTGDPEALGMALTPNDLISMTAELQDDPDQPQS